MSLPGLSAANSDRVRIFGKTASPAPPTTDLFKKLRRDWCFIVQQAPRESLHCGTSKRSRVPARGCARQAIRQNSECCEICLPLRLCETQVSHGRIQEFFPRLTNVPRAYPWRQSTRDSTRR